MGQMCVNCHGPGLGGAPRIGNAREWRIRARCGMPDLTDAELREAIVYMFETSTSNPD